MVEQTGSNPSEGPSFELAQSNKAAPMAPGDAHVTVRELFQRANGHEPLAAYMGEFPESAIFRRFATLNARNILYYQAELAYLERILKEAAETDSQSGDSTLEQFGQWWFKLSHCDQFPCGSSEQWKIFLEIRRVLNDYSELQGLTPLTMHSTYFLKDAALLQQLNLAKVHGPSRQALSLLNKWMKNPSRGNIRLFGEDSHIWTATTESELLALERRGCDDPLSSWITSFITNWFHRTIGKHINVCLAVHHNRTLLTALEILTSFPPETKAWRRYRYCLLQSKDDFSLRLCNCPQPLVASAVTIDCRLEQGPQS